MPETSSFDLFVSYSRRDNLQGRVSDFVAFIQESYRVFIGGKELRVFFDTKDVKGMDDWKYRILDGIRSTRLLLAFISPNYLESEYCAWELNEYLKYEVSRALLDEGVAPIYFAETPDWADKCFKQRDAEWASELRRRQHFDFRPWFDEGVAALGDGAVKARLDDLNFQIRERLSRINRVIDAKGNVDRHNDHFVGRKTEMRRMREMVRVGKVGVLTAVHGLGGIGKTALATEYAYAFAHEYPGGRWQVPCEGREDLRVVLASLAGMRDLEFKFTDEEKHELGRAAERVLNELKERAKAATPSRVLLLLDGVDQPKLLEPAQIQQLPKEDWLHLIATTRLGEHDLFSRQTDRAFIAVDELPEDDALAVVERYQPGSKFPDDATRETSRDIVRLLGCFTLAVEAAAVFLGQFAEYVTCAGFKQRLENEGLSGLERAVSDPAVKVRHDEIRLTATLKPTLERLGEAERLALTFAALMPADHVALPWLRSLVAKAFPELGKDAKPGYLDPWQTVLRRLYSLRLLQPTMEGNEVRMHRLLQEVVKLDVGVETAQALEEALLSHIKIRAEFLWDGWVQHDHRWELAPLAACAWHWIDRTDDGSYLANQAAVPLQRLGKFADAEALLRRALTIDEMSLGPDHRSVARDLNNLALLLRDTNRLAEAEPLYRRALAMHEKSLGPDHPTVATGLNNLARLLSATNRFAEAEPLYRQALAIYEKGFGPDHPNVARGLKSLAGILRATNRLTEAQPLFRRALAIMEKSLGPDHPDVATALNDLASLLYSTNRFAEAEALYSRALAVYEKSLGPNHPDVATALNNLASLLYNTNRFAEAEALYSRALAVYEKSLGPNHPNLAKALNNLAEVLSATNRLTEAEPLYHRVLAITERSFGPNHPDMATALNNLAGLLSATNRLTEAEPLYRRALAIKEKSFDPYHPGVATALNNLAWLLSATNRLAEAEPLLRQVVRIFAEFGCRTEHKHPHFDAAVTNYTGLLTAMGLSEDEVVMRLRSAIEGN